MLLWNVWARGGGIQVERMIAQQEVKHQGRGGGQAAARGGTATSRKSQPPPASALHAAGSGSQTPQGATAAGTDATKDSGTPQMTRDRIISKFSKKKPAYSGCRMLSQVSNILTARMPLNERSRSYCAQCCTTAHM